MKLKKLNFLMAIVLILGVFLTACSSSKDDSSDASSGDDNSKSGSDKKVTIVYAHGKDTTGGVQKQIDAFEKSHPNIHVKVQEMPNDSGQQHDSYVTSFNAKSSEIDVFNLDVVWPAEFAQAGYTLPLDRFIQQDNVDLSKINEGALSAAQFNGKQWAMPLYLDAGLLFYRKDIVDKAPTTWDELIADAKKYQGKNGTKFGYATQAKQYEGLVCNAVEFVTSYGGAFIDKDGKVTINSPQAIKGLKKLKEIITSDFVPDNVTNFSEPETDNTFIEGQTVFARNWPYMWSDANDAEKSKVVDKVGVAPLPSGDNGSASALGGWMIGINKYSKHPQESWEFVKYMATSKEGQKVQALETGRAPVYMDLYDDADVLKANPFFKEEGFKKAVENATSRPVAPNYQKVSDIIQIQVSKMISGEVTPEQAVANMEKDLKANLK